MPQSVSFSHQPLLLFFPLPDMVLYHSLSLWFHHLHTANVFSLKLSCLFCTGNTLLSQISLSAWLFSPLSRDYYFPQLHKLSSVPFRERTEEQQKLRVRDHSVVMSSVTIKAYFQDKAKQLYKIAIHVSPREIQGFPLKRGYARAYWQVSSKGSAGLLDRSSRAAQMWQLANYAAKRAWLFFNSLSAFYQKMYWRLWNRI